MLDRDSIPSGPEVIEGTLNSLPDGPQRIDLIDSLLGQYVYTRPRRARELLCQQQQLLTDHAAALPKLENQTGRDYHFNYHLALASLESQEYRYEQADAPFRAALDIAEERGDIADRLEIYIAYTGHLSNLGQTEEASDYLDRCYRLLESYPSDQLRARAACRHGYLYLLYFSYPKATIKFLEAETLLTGDTIELSPKDHYFYSLTQAGIGAVYQNSGESDQAVAAFEKAIDRCERFDLRARLPWHQLNLGKELVSSGEYGEALTYFQSIVGSDANGSASALAAAYANMGVCYHHLGQTDQASTYLDRAEDLYRNEKSPERVELASIGFMRATLLMDNGQWGAAIRQINLTLPAAEVNERTSDPRLLSMVADAYLYLSIAHANTGDYQAAYHHHCTYDQYNLRFHNQIDIMRQQQFAAQFRAEEREQENKQLKLKASQLKLRALRAQMNPHFLYNALNSIQSFISTNNAATASKYLAKFAMLMRQSLEYTNREYISLEEERQFLTDYLEINRHLRFEGQLTFTVTLDGELEEDIIGIPTMILQPYVENAIEHGLRGQPSGHIDVAFLPDGEDHLLAIVTDNGIGRVKVSEVQARDPTRVHHQSRGTEITESRLQLLSDEQTNWVEITDLYHPDGEAAGTQVQVRIPFSDALPRRATG
ncbi:tetratricopeptide (TPR) repeat protein/two-component sensor histidine kinase [Lewinella aquimaris]|uniref:Tetratricopeptide (TPR) repeat protein/two-component sensor histidine kinase n=1 Tax=Neolewinella aquimaris TaxID=1835722 RepID=A0A840E2J5_9BACT|nr:histidine kinase [Neolewinella aquimaris]MBB4079320.1 tetratricopeptide (TPR) repeat protein/two-component sensor histidine kinase [Neolewinella aquimaris]